MPRRHPYRRRCVLSRARVPTTQRESEFCSLNKQPARQTGEGGDARPSGRFRPGRAVAICFELVVNFGENIVAARRAVLTGPGPVTLRAGSHRIALHRALPRTAGSYVELSVAPVAAGWGAPWAE
jgi:hypothetical protein